MSTDTSGAAHDVSGDELALVLDAACAVVFHLDVASGDVRWSGPVAALTGAGEPPASLEALLACAHPDDAGTLRAAVVATAHDGTPSTCDLRVVWPDTTTHWLEARWRMVPEARGARTIVGIARQIDDERASLGRTRFLADVSAALDASLDMERTLAAVANLCVRDLGDWCSIDLADPDDELHNVAVAHVDPAQIELAQRLPADAILVEESPSSRPELHARVPARAPMGFLSAAMGGLGFALPGTIGVRMALPDRPVVAVLGDGSSLYAIQALWSAARYRVGALLLVMANGRYAVMDKLAADTGKPAPWPAFDTIDIAAMARAQGCEAIRIEDHADLLACLDEVLAQLARRDAPLLLEIAVAP